ncbi:unnamed protein product [Dimorphilus gyrociliatus]|uniref:RING-type domain-containing protein n=1 Tax=Dimorphilus gyrociliatus TaxID=2664684 RepID=A0A7I8V8P4_9ANNE|nr:unnamed protein product [Dimorphilus gyrociliatus]
MSHIFKDKIQEKCSSYEEEVFCPICNTSCLIGNAKCLPCDKSHSFCIKCLLSFKKVHNLKTGDKFSCPICRRTYFWPKHGVMSFQNCQQKETESMENYVKYNGNNNLLKREDTNEMLTKEQATEKEYDKTIEETERSLAISQSRNFDSLQQEFNEFFTELDKKLHVILDNAIELLIMDETIDRRNLGGETLDEKQTGETEEEFNSENATFNCDYGHSYSPFTELPFRRLHFKFDGEIKAVSSSKRAIYVLSIAKEKEEDDNFIHEIGIGKTSKSLLHSLTCPNDSVVDINAKSKTIMEIYLLETDSKDSSVLSSLTLTGYKYKLETVLDRSENGWSSVLCLDDCIILFNDKKIAKYIDNRHEKWSISPPEALIIDDINFIEETVYFLLTNNKILSLNLKNQSFEYPKMRLKNENFTIDENLINQLKNGHCLLTNRHHSYIIDGCENEVSTYPLSHDSMRYRIVHYRFTTTEFIVCLVDDKNSLTIQHFKL